MLCEICDVWCVLSKNLFCPKKVIFSYKCIGTIRLGWLSLPYPAAQTNLWNKTLPPNWLTPRNLNCVLECSGRMPWYLCYYPPNFKKWSCFRMLIFEFPFWKRGVQTGRSLQKNGKLAKVFHIFLMPGIKYKRKVSYILSYT